jgi:hypothetical protein
VSKILSEKELRESIKEHLCNPILNLAAETEWWMSLIKANCWLKGEQEMPDITLNDAAEHDASEPWRAGNFTDSLQAFGKKAQRDMRVKGFKPCKEWEND